jgi:hypothetical protein
MSERPQPCIQPEARQFDFWIGEWDLTWATDGRGTNVVRSRFEGCVIEEQFDGSPSLDLKGMSLSSYNPLLNQWQQTWVDNYGNYFDLVGEFKDGVMTLVHDRATEEGPMKNRMVFYNIADDSFDWNWELSKDGGKSWKLQWMIHYERK